MSEIKELQNTDLLGGFDDVYFETEDELIQIISLIKELDEAEYEFVIRNTLRCRGKAQ